MKRAFIFVAAAMAIAAGAASAATTDEKPVWRNANNTISVTLTQEPCGVQILDLMLSPQILEDTSKKANVINGGLPLQACWGTIDRDRLGIMSEDGAAGFLHFRDFKKEPDL